MKKEIKKILLSAVYPVLALLLLIGVWWIASVVKNNPLVLPDPNAVGERFVLLFSEKSFGISVGQTVLRTLVCFGISFLTALSFGCIAAKCPPIASLLSPTIAFLRSVPTVAVILILYAFFRSEIMTIVVGFLIAFPVLYSSFFSAISGVDKEKIRMATVYRLRPRDKFLHIYLASVAECLFDASRSTLGLTLKVVIAAEILTNISNSLGGKIQTAYASFEIAYLLAWTLVAILLSFFMEIAVFAAKKLCIGRHK